MRFLFGHPALYYKSALIIGDTHFGIEEKLRERGIHNRNFSELILNRIKKLLKMTMAKRLIILGDVKDNITIVDETTEKILEELEGIIELIIVKGNHDGGIEKICKNVKPTSGFVYEKLGLVHGNAWPSDEVMECEYIIAAHQHPMIEIKDKSGKKHSNSAWLVLDNKISRIKKHYKNCNEKIKLILMPAFNPVVGSGMRLDKEEHLGPLLNNRLFDVKNASVYKLDGTYLGKLSWIV